ncbi:MAG: virulence RhuM family protein [Rickettsiales bacterium]|nr:virulence RhuM family protein [Rickettsiales bacterium]
MNNNTGEIIIYKSDDGKTKISLKIENNSVWLNQNQIVELFNSTKSNISEHIKNIFESNELNEETVVRKFRTTATDGKNYDIKYYNLDVILSIGYRVRSERGIQFRNWASDKLKNYLIKGFSIDDEKLKANAGGNYWKELLDKIRDIRSSEKVFYRQVLDLYATSADYDSNSSITKDFFTTVQNKLNYAVHGYTASELIFERADSTKEFMGLTCFNGALPIKKEAEIAKNYLTESELKILNNLVSGYFDFAEAKAERHEKLYMKDYLQQLDNLLKANGEKILNNNGKISHEQAMKKVDIEYKKYKQNTLTPVEKVYLENIKSLEKKIKGKKDVKN